jgi:integrase
MPTLHHREKVLDGRAELISYARDPRCFYLRIYIPEKKGYVSQKIEGVQKIGEALDCVLDSYLELLREPMVSLPSGLAAPRTTRSQSSLQRSSRASIYVAASIAAFLVTQQEKVILNQLSEATLKYKTRTLTLAKDYLNSIGILNTSDLEISSFDSYPTFRRKGKLTMRQELMQIKEWCRYLKDHAHTVVDIKMPKIKTTDEDYSSNPPWDKDDMKLFWKELHAWVHEGETHNNMYVLHYRHMIWCYFAVLRTTGMRPKEALSLCWKDIEIENIGRTTSKGELADRYVAHIAIKTSKTGASREVTANCADRLLVWLNKTKVTQNNQFSLTQPVFSTLKDKEYQVLGAISAHKAFHTILSRLEGKLKGARLSERPYTIYSFRATRAMELLELGVDIGLAAKQLGHSPTVMLRTYARLPLRERATREAARIEFGKRDTSLGKVDLLSSSNSL